MTHVLLHGLSGIGPFEKMLADGFPALEIKDRAVVLRTPKRVSRLLDERGRAVGRIPLGSAAALARRWRVAGCVLASPVSGESAIDADQDGRRTQRKPRWQVAVSSVWLCRAAGR